MDIFGPLPHTKGGNQYVIVITDRSEVDTAIPATKNTVPNVVEIFIDYWTIPYDIPPYLLRDKGPQLVG